MIRCSLAQWLLCVIPVLIPGVDSVDQWLQNVDRYRSGEQSLKTFHGFSMRLSASQLQLVTCRSCPTGWHDESPGIPAGPSWQHPHGSSYIDDNRMQASLTMHMQSIAQISTGVCLCYIFSGYFGYCKSIWRQDTCRSICCFDFRVFSLVFFRTGRSECRCS